MPFRGRFILEPSGFGTRFTWIVETRGAASRLAGPLVGAATASTTEATRSRLERCPVAVRNLRRRLGYRAWELADRLGFAKTYDAEYLALADLLGCRVVTIDGRLRRGADRLGLVVLPTEL